MTGPSAQQQDAARRQQQPATTARPPVSGGQPGAGTTEAQAEEQRATEQRSLEERAAAVDTAMRKVENLETGAVRAAMELKESIEAFHKEALVALIRGLRNHPTGIEALQQASAASPFVQSLLEMHGLIRRGIDDRLRRAIDVVRPLLHQHGGDVEFVGREDDVVYVRLHGSCLECSLSSETLDQAVRSAVQKEAPEITRVELVTDDDATADREAGGGHDDTPRETIEHPGEGWHPGPFVHEVPDDRMLRVDVEQTSVVFVRDGETVRAWRNACPHQGMKLDGGTLERSDGEDGGHTLRCPWHGWTFDGRTGRCKNFESARLEPLPLIVRGGVAWVRVT